MPESSEIELTVMDNICSSNGVGASKTSAGASANVAKTQTAWAINTEQQRRRDCNTRPPHQGHATKRSSKICPEQGTNDSDYCTCSEVVPEQRRETNAYKGHARDIVINEHVVRSTTRGESNVQTQPPTHAAKNVTFNLPPNAASEGETAVAMDEGSSSRPSHSRSSPGLESMSRVSTLQSMQDSDSESNSRWSLLKKKLQFLSLAYFARRYYAVWLQKLPVKVNQPYPYSYKCLQ